jgi:hypothetical protein
MKKLILLGFALVFSVSSSFAYRIFYAAQVENKVAMWCKDSGGSCLPTHEVRPEQIAQSAESNELVV